MSDKIYNVKITDTETNQEICNVYTSVIFVAMDGNGDDDITTVAGAHCTTAHVGDIIIAALEGLRGMATQTSAGEWLFAASLRKFMSNLEEEIKNAN